MAKSMQPFEFFVPTAVKYGVGVCEELAAELKARGKAKPMLITDKGLINAGLAGKVIESLTAGGYEDVVVFDEVEPNPRDTTATRAAEMAKGAGVDSLIALGGGSAMDTAKMAGVLINNGGVVKDYEFCGGAGVVPKKIPTLFTIPTTVGTGSEVTFWAVIKDTKENYKLSVGSPNIAPEVAFVDPLYVETLPPAIVASTGLDALTHAIEGYTANCAEPITDACGIYAIELIGKSIRDAVYTDSLEARSNMLLASLIAGMCFSNSDVTACHGLSEALGGLYDIPHGIANAVMLPYVMEYNYVADLEKFANVAKALGINTRGMSAREAAYAGVQAVKDLNVDLKIPNLRAIGGKEEDLDELAMRSFQNPATESNPRPLTQSDYKDLLVKAFND